MVKASALQFSFNISIVLNLTYSRNKLHKTLDYISRDMLSIHFSEKSLGIVSLTHFVYDFSRKTFLKLYSFNWPNFIVWLSLILEILGNMCIAIVYFKGCDITIFENNLILMIKPCFFMTKKSRQKSKYLENGKSF